MIPGAWTQTAAPQVEPVTLEEAKRHLSETLDARDADIVQSIEEMRRHAETYTRRAFITQSWKLVLDKFPCADARKNPWGAIRVPLPPLQTVESVKYVDGDGTLQTMDSGLYVVDTVRQPGEIVPAFGESWPPTRVQKDAVQVAFTCGYGDSPDDVDPRAKRAILLWLHDMYEEHGSFVVGVTANELPFGPKQVLGGLVVLEAYV